MNDLMTVYQLGPQLEALLGLPKNVRSFELRCAVNEIVTVKCEYYPEITSIEAVLAEYELVPRTSPPEVAPVAAGLHFDEWMRERKNAAHAAHMERIACLPN
jgi:hypothetical protein